MDALEREARERGRVVWHDSPRGGAGGYWWRVTLADGAVKSGIAETEEHAWAVIREYVAARHREVRRIRRTPRSGV